MKLVAATVSKPGSKDTSQDAVGCRVQEGSIGCWVVADVQSAGGIAAQQAVKTLLDTFSDNPAVSQNVLASVFEWAQRDLLNLQAKWASSKAIRVSAALFCSGGHSALWAHIGNARVYAFRDGEIIAQTKDHSVSQNLANAGAISPVDIRSHTERRCLLRSLGLPGKFQPTILESRFIIQPGDLFLLCTDGFWEHVSAVEMRIDWCKSAGVKEWLEHMEMRLLKTVPSDHDSYSATAIWMEA